jgi:hypothetical protein
LDSSTSNRQVSNLSTQQEGEAPVLLSSEAVNNNSNYPEQTLARNLDNEDNWPYITTEYGYVGHWRKDPAYVLQSLQEIRAYPNRSIPHPPFYSSDDESIETTYNYRHSRICPSDHSAELSETFLDSYHSESSDSDNWESNLLKDCTYFIQNIPAIRVYPTRSIRQLGIYSSDDDSLRSESLHSQSWESSLFDSDSSSSVDSLVSDTTSRRTPPPVRPPLAELPVEVIRPTRHSPEPQDTDLFGYSSLEND